MRLIKGRKNRKFLIVKILVLVVCVYFIFLLVDQQVELTKKKNKLDSINQQLSVQEVKNQEMKHMLELGKENSKSYIEKIARKSLDFTKRGERVFINILGN